MSPADVLATLDPSQPYGSTPPSLTAGPLPLTWPRVATVTGDTNPPAKTMLYTEKQDIWHIFYKKFGSDIADIKIIPIFAVYY